MKKKIASAALTAPSAPAAAMTDDFKIFLIKLGLVVLVLVACGVCSYVIFMYLKGLFLGNWVVQGIAAFNNYLTGVVGKTPVTIIDPKEYVSDVLDNSIKVLISPNGKFDVLIREAQALDYIPMLDFFQKHPELTTEYAKVASEVLATDPAFEAALALFQMVV